MSCSDLCSDLVTNEKYSLSANMQVGSIFYGVTDGTRTRDTQDHNLVLYQLNYSHHRCFKATRYRLTHAA